VRGIFKIVGLVALSVLLMGASCGNPPPVDCSQLALAVYAADESGNQQLMQASRLAYSAAGCGTIPMPAPEPTPDPTPEPTPEPEPPVEPPLTPDGERPCAPPEIVFECWNKPPGGSWEWIGPDPSPPPVDPPTPGCDPPGPVPNKWDEPALVAVDDRDPDFLDEVLAATTKLGDRSHCRVRDNLDSVAAQLALDLNTLDIIRGREAVFILRADGLWEENHTVAFGTSTWANSGRGKYMGSHRYDGPPPSDDPCPNPPPDPNKMMFALHHKGDSTYKTESQPEFCASVGYCCMPGTGDPENTCGTPTCIPRGGCPVWGDGHPDRPACEAKLIGVQRWWCNGIELEACGATRNPNCIRSNPAQAICTGRVKTCTADLTTCNEADW